MSLSLRSSIMWEKERKGINVKPKKVDLFSVEESMGRVSGGCQFPDPEIFRYHIPPDCLPPAPPSSKQLSPSFFYPKKRKEIKKILPAFLARDDICSPPPLCSPKMTPPELSPQKIPSPSSRANIKPPRERNRLFEKM